MAHYEGFQAVEAMQVASKAAGWECEYRQIEAGLLEAETAFQQVGRSSLICETSNRRIEFAAKAPDAATAVLVPLPGTRGVFNGRRVSDDRIIVVAPDVDIHAVTNGGGELWSIHLPTDLLDESLNIDRLGTRVTAPRPACLAKFRAAIKLALVDDRENVMDHHETRFADLVQKLLSNDAPATRSECNNHRYKRRALVRAMDFIEAHLAKPLRIGQVSTYANVSRSTLERLFRREFQQTPSSYVRARRLDAVRRELAGGLDFSKTIADVAIAHGFTHMGRFSSMYRRQFGRLPSEDRLRFRN
jgi:AraC-like DNA-binding protein